MSDTAMIMGITIIVIMLAYPIPIIFMNSNSFQIIDSSGLENIKEPTSTLDSLNGWDYIKIYFSAMYFQIPNTELNPLLALLVLVFQIIMCLVVYILIRSP